MSKFSRRNSKPDCIPHDKSSHRIYPPELSNVFSRIDPIPDLPPFYVGKDSPLSLRKRYILGSQSILPTKR